MSKYKDAAGGEIANIEEIGENFQEAVKRAEEYAKAETQKLRERIMHYRELDFEQIKKEITEQFEREYVEEDNTVSKKDFFRDLKYKDVISVATPYVDFKHDTEEEKEALYQRYLDDTKAYNLREQLRLARSRDIVYDSMTEEQIEESCGLYYAFVLKETLVDIKESTLAAKATFGSKERKVVNAWREIGNAAYDEVQYLEATEVERVNILNDEKLVKKQNIKEAIGNTFRALGGSALFGLAGGMALYEMSGETLPYGTSMGIGFGAVSAAVLTLCGVFTYREFTRTKKAVEKAKELGVYDLLIERAKASNELFKYNRELGKQANLEERINEEFPEEAPGMGR